MSRFRPLKHTLTGHNTEMMMKLVVESRTQRVVGCHIVGDDAGVRPLVLSASSIACDGIETLDIPAGSGSAWLAIRTEGTARAELRQGLVTIPSATRPIVWHPTSDDGSRQSERLICFGDGRLTIESAVETTIGP